MTFALENYNRKLPDYDLNKYWFYLDEVSHKTPSIKGPVLRSDIRNLLDERILMFLQSYIWHPILGHK